MTYSALALDYDGTLASEGRVVPNAIKALLQVSQSGRKLILVTGRIIDELLAIFPEIKVFDLIVGENGALLYQPKRGEISLLAEPKLARLEETLRREQISPVISGQCLIGTLAIYQDGVERVLRSMNLPHQVIRNKNSLMILPPGISKKSGLQTALTEMKIPPQEVVCAGDAENDLELFEACGFRVAVQNALPIVKSKADWVTEGNEGEGICQLIERLLSCRLRSNNRF